MKYLIALGLACGLALPAAAQLQPGYGPNISLDLAQKAVQASLKDAQEKRLTMAVAVLDPAGNLVAFGRVDGTQTASIGIAIDKAKSAVAFRRPTKAFEDALIGGRMAILALTGAVPIDGGIPLIANNQIIGAIGVSGGTAQEDGQVAAVGVSAAR